MIATRAIAGRGADVGGILAAYGLVCAAALPWFLRRAGPDAVSYISIALKVRDGWLGDAINGFWSPAFSWLLAPFVRLGPPPEAVAKCLQVAIGAGAIMAIWWLCRRLKLPSAACRGVALACVPPVAMQALVDTTPDLLVAALLTVYVGIVAGEGYPRSVREAAAAGGVGGLAYLAKAYAFPFFVVHFLLLAGWLLVRRGRGRDDRRRIVLATLVGLLAFGAVASPWVAAISLAYGRPTIGTTGAYQAGFVGGARSINPTRTGGLSAPPNGTAVSAWEDPTVELKSGAAEAAPRAGRGAKAAVRGVALEALEQRPKSDATAAIVVRLRRVVVNLGHVAGIVVRFSAAAPLILLGLAAMIARSPSGPQRDRMVVLLGTLLVFPSGYLVMFVVPRYLWLMTFLLAAAAGLLATTSPWPARSASRMALAIAVAASFAVWPAYVVVRSWNSDLERTPAMATRLAAWLPPGTRIASDAEWGLSNAVAFHLGGRYYGMLSPSVPRDDEARLLERHSIEAVLVWGDPHRHPWLQSAREVDPAPGSHRRPRVFLLPSLPAAVPDADPAPSGP